MIPGPGTLLGRYRLVGKIGSGGMGEVFRAVDTTLGREVAVKVLPAEAVATPEKRRRFEAEARSAATVSHPNLVPVYDVGESQGIPFIVQELVEGETLDKILERRGALPPEQAAEWTFQTAEGLARAHEAGILHRDVKPGNLIIGSDGRLRVLDFGLAKILHAPRGQHDTLTSEGIVVGTVHYMSPEQALGHELDARSDVFSLGIVFYQMLAADRPFEGATAVDVMHAIAYDPPRPLNTTALPAALVSVVEKALRKNAADRYQSIREMGVDLRRFLKRSVGSSSLQPAVRSESEPTVAVASGSSERRRRVWRLGAAAAVAAAAVALGLLKGREPVAHTPLSSRVLIQTDSREEGPAFSPDGRAFAYASNVRGDFDIYYRLLTGGASVRLTDSPEDERDPFFTPDGSFIYFSRGDATAGTSSIWSVPTLGGAMRRILDSGSQPALSPDGRLLVFLRTAGDKTSLWLSDPNGGSPRELLDGRHGELKGARFAADGKWIAFLWTEAYPGSLGDLWRIPVEGGGPVRLTNDRRDVWGHVAFLPGDAAILFGSARTGNENIWMVSPRGGTPRPVATGTSSVISPSVSPDGKTLLVQTRRLLSDAWEYSLADGKGRALTNAGSIWGPQRFRDGRLLYADWSRQEEELDLFLEDASGSRTYLAAGSNPRAEASGRRVYFSTALGGGRRGLAVVETEGGPARRLTEPGGIDEYPDPAPDESRIVFCRKAKSGGGVLSLSRDGKTLSTIFPGDALVSRAGEDGVVFQSCAPPGGCGVYAVGYGGGTPRLLIPDARWPALSTDRRTVYALTGPKAKPALVSASLAGSEPRRLFELNASRDPQFWAVFTIDVAGDALVATHQRVDDDIALLEGVFR